MRAVAKFVLVLSLLSLAACGSIIPREKAPQARIYVLDEIGDIKPAEKPGCLAISVNTVRSAPGYGSTRMLYTRGDHRLDYFAYHKWADSPGNMLFPLEISALERSGRFKAVLPPSAPEPSSVRLDTEVESLKQVFDGNSSRLELNVRARLYINDQMAGSKLFELQEESGSGPESGVAAANRATGKLMQQLVAWLDETIGKSKVGCQ